MVPLRAKMPKSRHISPAATWNPHGAWRVGWRWRPHPRALQPREFAMKHLVLVVAACSTLAIGGCTTEQGAVVGGVTGAAVGGLATNSVGGAIIGAGVGALAGAILVESNNNGYCTYRYRGRLYRDRCRY
jgi:hypothetical protein